MCYDIKYYIPSLIKTNKRTIYPSNMRVSNCGSDRPSVRVSSAVSPLINVLYKLKLKLFNRSSPFQHHKTICIHVSCVYEQDRVRGKGQTIRHCMLQHRAHVLYC